MTDSFYHFYPSLRTGLATVLDQSSSQVQVNGVRAEITVQLTLEGTVISSSGVESQTVSKSVQLWGPGDIVGFDDRIITRTDPKPNIGDFEPNYFPFIEFADPDFLWRFTAKPIETNGNGNLTPWITLIVLRAEATGDEPAEFTLERDDRSQRPYLITNPQSLPDLTYAERWDHVQVTGSNPLETTVEEIIRLQPHRAVCRLLCPRRLRPRTKYQAFIVPTFEAGRRAGRGESLDNISALDLAWSTASSTPIELPYYYTWEFRTGLRGDFEHLVRLLEKRELQGLGLRDMQCDQPGFGISSVTRGTMPPLDRPILQLEGGLHSNEPTFQYTPWGGDKVLRGIPDFQSELANLLNHAEINHAETNLNQQPFVFNMVAVAPIEQINASLDLDGCTVTINWHTQRAATCQVQYERHVVFKQNQTYSITIPALPTNTERTDHRVTLQGLAPGETYHLRIICTDSAGAAVITPDGTLKLPPLPSVVPPLYGRWHAAQRLVEPDQQNFWFHRLNLDPRHRVAAGMGAEVVRKQQEALMASAWEQLGEIEKANDLLRRAQMGRAASNFLYQRLGSLLVPQSSDPNTKKYLDSGLDAFLSLTRPIQKRLPTTQTNADGTSVNTTIAQKLTEQSQLPAAALDPAFRRIARPRGPLRQRQPQPQPGLLRRLAEGTLQPAGSHPRPDGMLSVCDVTKALVTLSINDVWATIGANFPLYEVKFTVSLSQPSPLEVTVEFTTEDDSAKAGTHYSKISGTLHFQPNEKDQSIYVPIMGDFPALFESSKSFKLILSNPTNAVIVDGTGVATIAFQGNGNGGVGGDSTWPAGSLRSRSSISVSNLVDPERVPTSIVTESTPTAQSSDHYFCERNITCSKLESEWPQAGLNGSNTGIPDQSKTKDLVCEILDNWLNNQPAPKTPPTPPKDFLGRIADDILPALNPETTIPARTQQRLHLSSEVKQGGDPLGLILAAPEFPQPMYEPLRDISQDWILPGVEKVPQNTIGLLASNWRFIEAYMVGLNHEFAKELLWRGYPTDQRGTYFRQFWDASSKDIPPIHTWSNNLGQNRASSQTENLVLIIRGDLLKKYPNTLIYAIEGSSNPSTAAHHFPIFSGTLPPDLTFLGFPFDKTRALGNPNIRESGIYFVIEERISEARFGMDNAKDENALGGTYATWADLTWAHFSDPNDSNVPIKYDQYLNGLKPIQPTPIQPTNATPAWKASPSSAAIAHITCQDPVRMIIHARDMLPD